MGNFRSSVKQDYAGVDDMESGKKPLINEKGSPAEESYDLEQQQEGFSMNLSEERHKDNSCRGYKKEKIISANFEVDAPVSVVWKVLEDGKRYGEWHPCVKKVEYASVGKKAVVYGKDGSVTRDKLEVVRVLLVWKTSQI